jgi:hypothetical protein
MPTLHIYTAPAGQYAGKLVDEGQEVFGVAGCNTPDEVEDAACEAGYWPYSVELDELLTGMDWWNELTEVMRLHWLKVADIATPAAAYRAYLFSITTEL